MNRRVGGTLSANKLMFKLRLNQFTDFYKTAASGEYIDLKKKMEKKHTVCDRFA